MTVGGRSLWTAGGREERGRDGALLRPHLMRAWRAAHPQLSRNLGKSSFMEAPPASLRPTAHTLALALGEHFSGASSSYAGWAGQASKQHIPSCLSNPMPVIIHPNSTCLSDQPSILLDKRNFWSKWATEIQCHFMSHDVRTYISHHSHIMNSGWHLNQMTALEVSSSNLSLNLVFQIIIMHPQTIQTEQNKRLLDWKTDRH